MKCSARPSWIKSMTQSPQRRETPGAQHHCQSARSVRFLPHCLEVSKGDFHGLLEGTIRTELY